MFEKLSYVEDNTLPEALRKQLYSPAAPHIHPVNTLPLGFTKLTQKQFAQSDFFLYGFQYTEFRQAQIKKNGPLEDLHLYWRGDGTGYCIVRDYWKGKISYYRVGHVHDWFEAGDADKAEFEKKFGTKYNFTYGNCCHNYLCRTCGDHNFVDSSD